MSEKITIKTNGDIEIRDDEHNKIVNIIRDTDSEHPATFTYIKHVETLNL